MPLLDQNIPKPLFICGKRGRLGCKNGRLHISRLLPANPAEGIALRVFLQHILRGRDKLHAIISNQAVRPRARRAENAARHGVNVPPLLKRIIDRYLRAASQAGFHHDNAAAKSAHNPIADRKILRQGLHAERIFADNAAALRHIGKKLPILPRINHIYTTAEHANRLAACVQSTSMPVGINTARQAADDPCARLRQATRQITRDLAPISSRLARADNGKAEVAVRRQLPAIKEQIRRVVNRGEKLRIVRLRHGDNLRVREQKFLIKRRQIHVLHFRAQSGIIHAALQHAAPLVKILPCRLRVTEIFQQSPQAHAANLRETVQTQQMSDSQSHTSFILSRFSHIYSQFYS